MKPSKRNTGPTLYWHPNFRIAESLPDTKVIRTSFLVNFVAALAAILVGYLVVQQELDIAEVRAKCADWTRSIDEGRPRYTKGTQLQTEYAGAEKKMREIESFVAPRLVASGFLHLVAETLPRLIVLDSVELNTSGVHIRGTVVGSSASIAQSYVDQLAANPKIKEIFESVRLSSQVRDPAGNRFTFDIDLKLKTAKSAS